MKPIRSDVQVFPPMKKLVLLLAIAVTLSLDASAAVYYVDKDNTGTQDGLSWPTAYTAIQPAIDAAYPGGGEVWVAEGTYSEQRTSHPHDTGENTGSVMMKEGVVIYGGFSGTESLRDERDWHSQVTTIDGSTSRGGQPAYHVIVGANNATLDGFTVTGGNANSDTAPAARCGGGMYNLASSPTVTNCTFTNNSATYAGGMINEEGSSPTLTNCTFTNNLATDVAAGMLNYMSSSPTLTDCTFTMNATDLAGGMYNEQECSPTLTTCTFTNNSATNAGGGMLNYKSSSPTLTDCTFTGNSAPYGGGIYNEQECSPTVTTCTFTDNSANYGGGMYNEEESSPMVTTCTFTDNSAGYNGGGMSNDSSSPTVTSCTFAENRATQGGGMYNEQDCSPTLTICTFRDNRATHGGGMRNKECSPTLTTCTFTENRATYGGGMSNSGSSATVIDCEFTNNWAILSGGGMSNGHSSPTVTNSTFSGNEAISEDGNGGGMSNSSSSPMVTNCTFSGNSAPYGGGMCNYPLSSPTVTNCTFYANTAGESEMHGGGGMFNRNDSSPTVTNCAFIANSTPGDGGGMCSIISSSPTVTNCTFAGNEAGAGPGFVGHGGGMSNWADSSPTVTNCTFTENSASALGGGMSNSSSLPTVTNCIFWGDSAPEIHNYEAVAVVTYSDVQGGYPGEGNIIGSNPLFVDDDYHLEGGSPCIDAGDPDAQYNDGCLPPGQGTARNDMGSYGGPGNCPPNDPPTIALVTPPAGDTLASGSYDITWTDEDPDDEAAVSLYYDSDDQGYDGTLIMGGISEDDETDAYTWDVPSVAPGTYWVYAEIDDGVNLPVYCYSPGSVTVDGDDDGLPDEWEVQHGLDPTADDADHDLDADGLTNAEEYAVGTLPNDNDTDDDGLTDGQEVNTYLTDPVVSDMDGDGLLDGDEVNTHNTDPTDVDSDGDTLTDGDEVNVHGTDPNSVDSDGDGLTDGDEVSTHGTSPVSWDSDNDELPDGWEVDNGLDPTVASGDDGTGGDPDGDGVTNGQEYAYGTLPHNADTDGDTYTDREEIDHGSNPTEHTDTPTPWLVSVAIKPQDTQIWTFMPVTFTVTGEMRDGSPAELSQAVIAWLHVSGVGDIDQDSGVFESVIGGAVEISVTVELDGVTQSDGLLFDVASRALLTVASETFHGDEVASVPVTLSGGGAEVAGIAFALVIDSQIVEVLDIVAGEQAVVTGKTVGYSGVDADTYDVVVGGNSSVLADGEVVVVTLKRTETSQNGQCSPLLLQYPVCYDPASQEIETIGVDGQCCVAPPGDIDCNGTADAVDVQLVINRALGIDVPWYCDIDGNGSVDAVDVQLVINAALGIAILG